MSLPVNHQSIIQPIFGKNVMWVKINPWLSQWLKGNINNPVEATDVFMHLAHIYASLWILHVVV